MIESVLQGIDGVVIYLGDILITGPTEKDHLKSLEEVLKRLDKAGLRVKMKKCKFMKPEVDYLGHKIDKTGLHPLPNKVQAIQDAATPLSVHELKSYLGLLTYCNKFLPQLSSTLFPLYRLLQKDFQWSWGVKEDRAFSKSKELLTSTECLTHFDSLLPLIWHVMRLPME